MSVPLCVEVSSLARRSRRFFEPLCTSQLLIYHDFINENNRFVEYTSQARSSSASSDEALAPVLGALKNGRASASSSRGLLLTVLGELVLTNAGKAWTQTLIEVLGTLDIEEKAARQAIARLADRGWLLGQKSGRRTQWSLTPEVTGLLEEGASRIYSFGQMPTEWNDIWLLINASVPERNRKVRYALSSGLSWAGFGTLGHGWWVSAKPKRESEAKRVLASAGITDATSFVAMQGSMGNPNDLANRAWNLDAVRTDYESFLTICDQLESDIDQQDPLSQVSSLIQLVHEWRRFPFLDPDLPTELLPPDWPGTLAAARFADLHRQWTEPATKWWLAAEASRNT